MRYRAIRKRAINCIGVLVFFAMVAGGLAQSSIVYFDYRSPTQVGYWFAWALNPDNWGDFYIDAGGIFGTFGANSNTYTFSPAFGAYDGPDVNEFLAGDFTTVQIAGSLIADSPPNGASWTSPGQEVPLTTEYVVVYPTNTTVSWSGPFASLGDGYVGVRFLDADGWHYGWIHLCLPPPDGSLGVVVLDSAYNSLADVPIRAGAKPVVVPQRAVAGVENGNLRLQWVSDSTTSYQIQFRNCLDSGIWTNLDVIVTATGTNCGVDLPTIGSLGYYQVVKVN